MNTEKAIKAEQDYVLRNSVRATQEEFLGTDLFISDCRVGDLRLRCEENIKNA